MEKGGSEAPFYRNFEVALVYLIQYQRNGLPD